MTPAERLAAIRERMEKATKGRWYVKYGCDLCAQIPPAERQPWQQAGYVLLAQIGSPSNPSSVTDPHEAVKAERDANAEFLAHARADIPWLLAQLAEREGLIRELVAWVDSKGVEGAFVMAAIHGYTCQPEESDAAQAMWDRARAVAPPTAAPAGCATAGAR
jgi:hypothetical protein